MTDEKEPDQLRQRRANFQELQRLGIPPYPHVFERTDTIQALVEAHGGKAGEELEATRIQTRTAGRILAIRSFGKANFLAISDGGACTACSAAATRVTGVPAATRTLFFGAAVVSVVPTVIVPVVATPVEAVPPVSL